MVVRTGINMNSVGANDYAFINHIKCADAWGPVGTAYSTGVSPIFTQIVDANGIPSAAGDGFAFGGGMRIPDSTHFAGPYVLTWTGDAEWRFTAGTWVVQSQTGTNYTQVQSGRWEGTNMRIVLTFTGTGDGAAQLINFNILSTGHLGGTAGKGFAFYRLEDEEDYLAGKFFRAPFKQVLADLNPSFIRVMNWLGINSSKACRWEHRTLPEYINYNDNNASLCGYNWSASGLLYGDTATANQMTLSAVAGTSGTAKHGDLVTCRIGAAMVRAGFRGIAAVTKANPGQVTSHAHGYSTGDKVLHTTVPGMTQLERVPVTVTVVDPDNYTIGINTSGFTDFTTASVTGTTTSGSAVITSIADTSTITAGNMCTGPGIPLGSIVSSKTATTVTLRDQFFSPALATASAAVTLYFNAATCEQYITLKVGSQAAYPVIFANGTTLAGHYAATYMNQYEYKTFSLDLDYVVGTDIQGAWVFNENGATNGHNGGVPLELCTALVNEVMATTRTDGRATDPIGLWICVPHRGMLSVDTDYLSGSNWATNAVGVCLNGSTINSITYAGLNAACTLYVEFSNETWNSGGAFYQTSSNARKGFLRYGGGASDFTSYSALRSMKMAQDIHAAFPANSRIHITLGLQGTVGFALNSNNQLRCDGGGTSHILTDAVWNPGAVAPITLHDSTCFAAYISTLNGSNLTFVDTNLATYATSWASHAGDAVAQEADCANYITDLTDGTTLETIEKYIGLVTTYANAMQSRGKQFGMYEGGWDHPTTGTYATFLAACKRSRAWALAWMQLMREFDGKANAFASSDYIMTSSQWGHVPTNAFSNSVAHVEWSGLDLAWTYTALHNRGVSRLHVKN
jgi:hypothetical protein